MSQMTSTLCRVAVCLTLFLLGAPALADGIPPERDVEPPHAANESCTIDSQETEILECIECEIEHDDYSSNNGSCFQELRPWGFEMGCGSEWIEIWCRDRNAPHEYQPGDNWEEEGCSVALRQKGSFRAQLALVIGLIVFGLFVRKRLRS